MINVDQTYISAAQKLTYRQRTAVLNYTSEKASEFTAKDKSILDATIRSMPPLPTANTVFRAVRLSDSGSLTLNIDKLTSTSVNAAATRRFGNIGLQIEIPAGTRCLILAHQLGLTRHMKDMEVLLPSGGYFELTGTVQIDMQESEWSIFPPDIRAQLEKFKGAFADKRVFLTAKYHPQGMLSRSMAAANLALLKSVKELL